MKLHKSYQRTNYAKHSLSNKGVDVWNDLGLCVKNIAPYYMGHTLGKIFRLRVNILEENSIDLYLHKVPKILLTRV